MSGGTGSLREAVSGVTVEEFRAGDLRYDRDARLGRQLLLLLTSTEWVRRTTENVEISRVRVVDTQVVVDVDLGYVKGLLDGDDPLWLPVVAIPAAERARPGDAITSMECSDAAGARVHKAPQSEVQRRLAAALAELLFNRLPRSRPGDLAGAPRDEQVLLTAAVRRLLAAGLDPLEPGDQAADLPDGTPGGAADTGRARTEERLGDARAGLLSALDLDLHRVRPVQRSRLMQIVDAFVGMIVVLVPVERSMRPTSFAVRMPGRRLHQVQRSRWRISPHARLVVDLMNASAHSDRIVRLTLPDGITTVTRPDADSEEVARIEGRLPRPVAELRALTDLTVAAQGWSQRRLASMAVDAVDSTLAVLTHFRVPSQGGRGSADGTRALGVHLQQVRTALLAVVECATAPGVAGQTEQEADLQRAAAERLRTLWDGGAQLPLRLQRRLAINVASPGLVHVRATAVDGAAQRTWSSSASLDVEVAVGDSTVLDTARDMNAINLGLLALLGLGVVVARATPDPQILATVLTLFPIIQAGRVDRPDRSTMLGLLAQPTYLLSLATVFPPLLLAASLALMDRQQHLRRDIVVGALVAVALQAGLQLLLRRRSTSATPLGPRPSLGRRPPLTLTTQSPPDLSRLELLRGTWASQLVVDAVALGSRVQAFLAEGPDVPGALDAVLDDAVPAGASLQGLLHGTGSGRALSFVVAGGDAVRQVVAGGDAVRQVVAGGDAVRGSDEPHACPGDRFAVHPVSLDPGRLGAAEPPAWIVEVLVGLPALVLSRLATEDHPVTEVAQAARVNDYPTLFVQWPSPAPAPAADGLEWVRVRIGVPYVPGEDLGGLLRLLDAVDALRQDHPVRGRCSVHVYVVPELATYESTQTAPEDAGTATRSTARGRGLRPLLARELRTPSGAPLVVCGNTRIGLLADLLRTAGRLSPGLRLDGVTMAAMHGLAVVYLHLSTSAPGGTSGLGRRLAEALADTDELTVVLDGDGGAETEHDGQAAVDEHPDVDGPLLRVQLRVPERSQALRDVLARVRANLHEVTASLDVRFALVRVVDGRVLQGRLLTRLPSTVPSGDGRAAHSWEDHSFDDLAERPTRWADPVDDPQVSADLVRVAQGVAGRR